MKIRHIFVFLALSVLALSWINFYGVKGAGAGSGDPNETCPGDFNGDYIVGSFDLGDLLAHWGECPATCMYDIFPVDPDGVVNPGDLAQLLSYWGPCAAVGSWNEEQKLIASDDRYKDHFGQHVAISGDIVVVGAVGNDDAGSASGSAYIFRFDGTSWFEQEKLLASDAAEADFFGSDVAVSGDVAVIGAYRNDDNGSASGSAYIFRFDGDDWIEEQKLLGSEADESARFGYSVSISGDVAVIGAYGDDTDGINQGDAYIFRFNGTTWVQEQKLSASDGEELDHFGWDVAISGNVAVIGAKLRTEEGIRSGAAYVYRFNGNTWIEEQKLTVADGHDYDSFGYSVAVSGDVAVIGAYGDDTNGNTAGSAYIFRFNGDNWYEQQKLYSGNPSANSDHFGWSVAVSNDQVMVGAYGDFGLDETTPGIGTAYVYRYNGENWDLDNTLYASDGANYDFFGDAVALDGGVAVIGAYANDDACPTDPNCNSGSAYVFKEL